MGVNSVVPVAVMVEFAISALAATPIVKTPSKPIKLSYSTRI
jgi:hypothetical protein